MCYIDPNLPWMPSTTPRPFSWPKDWTPDLPPEEPITTDLDELEHLYKSGLLKGHEIKLLEKLRKQADGTRTELARQEALADFRKLKASKKGK